MSWFEPTAEDLRDVARERLLLEVLERVTEAIGARDVSRAELARRLDISPSEITQRLRGRRNLQLSTVADMLHALGFDARISLEDRRERWDLPWRYHRVINDWTSAATYYTRTGSSLRPVKAGSAA